MHLWNDRLISIDLGSRQNVAFARTCQVSASRPLKIFEIIAYLPRNGPFASLFHPVLIT